MAKPKQDQGNGASERGCGERLKQIHWRPASQLCQGFKFITTDAFDNSSRACDSQISCATYAAISQS